MGTRLRWVGRQLLALLFFPVGLSLRLLRRLALAVWQAAGRLGLWIRSHLARLARALWRLLGRMGLAERFILSTLFGPPLSWMSQVLQRLFRALIAFVGRLGLALRDLLRRLFWQPLLFVTAPLRWLYGKTLRRPVGFLWLSLCTFCLWLGSQVGRRLRRLIRAVAGSLAVLWTRLHLGWWVVRYGLPLPEGAMENAAHLFPAGARLSRYSTALVTTGVIVLLSFITASVRQPVGVTDAGSLLTEPTSTPGLPAEPTAVARPGQLKAMPSSPVPLPPTPSEVDPWPTPDPLGLGGSVAYTHRQNGNSDIFALTIGRTQPIRLTYHPADDRDPAWSPDGRLLAFASRRDGNWEIYVLNLQDGQLQRVTHDPAFDGGPSWSPDGEWLVYESYQAFNLDLFIVRSDGNSPPIRLTEHPAPDFSPAWSPGGRHIAFTSWRSGNKDIYILPLDAATDERAINVTESPDRSEDHPTFDPGAHKLAYYDGSEGFELVYTIPLEDYLPAGPPVSVGQGRHPTWSPDGESLLYVHGTNRRNFLIATSMHAWGVAPQTFTADGYLDDVVWTPSVLPPDLEQRLSPGTGANGDPLFVELQAPAQQDGPPYLLWELETVKAPAPYLSDRVDQSFQALRDRVISDVGWDFLGEVENMYAPLGARPLPGESDRSWDKAGRAFDFYYRFPLSDDPQVEVVQENLGYQTFWRVYLKTAAQDGTQGEPLRRLPWDFRARYGFEPRYYDQGGKLKDYLPAGYYVDFTALADDYGWTWVPSLANWRTYFQGIRYWRYENRQGLTWEEAMLEIFTPKELLEVFDAP